MPSIRTDGLANGSQSLISFDQGVMTYRILHDLCPENLRHKFTERSMISEYRTRNRGEQEKLGWSLQSEVSISLVSKTGMISLTKFKKNNPSVVLKQVLESIFRTFHRTQTRPLSNWHLFILFIYFYFIHFFPLIIVKQIL